MQWCANECPEALNWRVQMLVIENKRRIALSSHAEAVALAELLAEGFLRQLEHLAASIELQLDVDPRQALPFFVSDAVETRGPPRLLGGAGWAVLAANVDERPRRAGPALNALQAWLTAWIRRYSGPGTENCFLIDRRDGADMPFDWETALASAVDHGADAVDFDGRHEVLDPVVVARAQGERLLALNPFVARVDDEADTPLVHFRRYWNAFTPSPSQVELIARAREGLPLRKALSGRPGLAADLALLRRQRVVCLAGLARGDSELFGASTAADVVERRPANRLTADIPTR
jgi:hypothetical protein